MNYLTVDVEEWWSVQSFAHLVDLKRANLFDDRIGFGLDIILSLLNKCKKKATFFILGRIAENHPEYIEKIFREGHDIGTHGFSHKLAYHQNEEEFEDDLIKSIESIRRITGERVNKYRAPSYSITKDSLWAIKILVRNGIEIDSSIFPFANKRCGIENAPHYPYKIDIPDMNKYIVELPPTVYCFGKFCVPVTGGFFFRFFPRPFIDRYLNKSKMYNMFVFHNWELDPDQPKLKVGMMGKIIHYYGIKKNWKKVEHYLENYNLSTLRHISGIENRVNINEFYQ